MTIARPKVVALVLAFVMLAQPLARAVMPETGVYYDSLRQGLGYYIEVQGTTLVMVSFAFDQATGKPLFYYASGTITKSNPTRSYIFDPPVTHVRENAYQFSGDLYQFDTGPCITCDVKNWDTSKHAQLVGQVFLRFADVDNMYVNFKMSDGTGIGSLTRRQVFGQHGFIVREQPFYIGSDLLAVPKPLADFIGDWIFTDIEDILKPPLRLHFDKAVGPLPITKDIPIFGSGSSGSYVQFTDTKKNAVLTCLHYGCGLQVDGETVLVFKFWDIGSGQVLAFSGEPLMEDGDYMRYRGEHLISGIRITDPIPDAPPPPTDTGGQP
ncbi:MAG: hypothetical protein L0H70_00195 [Xanthomonadales bacterium]|nr:hypothetical protein [Xanthomonadales bacterium]